MSTKTNKASVPLTPAHLGPPCPPAQPAPTDLELMLYADGELEGERLAAVEAYLADDEGAQRKMVAMGIVSSAVREQALDAAKGAKKADDIVDLVMGSIAAEPKQAEKKPEATPVPSRRKPANDNARGLMVIAAIAAAAAAALLLWGRGPVDHGGVASGRSAAPALTAPAPLDHIEHGVEVSAVDFGAQTGAVFYVPSDNAEAVTTTVVWLSDDASGGDE